MANIYLHYVLDLWVEQWRRKRTSGQVIMVRYADDFLLGFQYETDAKAFLEHLRVRLAGFGLELHTDKTRLLEFGRFAAQDRAHRGQGAPETFDFLGFTHICGRRRRGGFLLVRQSSSKRLRLKLKGLRETMRKRLHWPIAAQGRWLAQVLRGYMGYHAIPANYRALSTFRGQLIKSWFRSLRRRSQKRRLDWEKMSCLAKRWIPNCQILHPWPQARFDAKYPTQAKSPVR